MSDRLRFIILGCVIAAMVGIYSLLQTGGPAIEPASQAGLQANTPAPDFSLPRLDGDVVRLSDFRGKVVFLNIWATWCPPCREEMPDMEKLYAKMKGEDFEILAVSIDAEGADAVKPFVEKHKLSFPVLLDARGMIKSLYRITGVPETYIIDKDGTIVSKIVGPRDWASAKVVKLLENLARADGQTPG